DGVKAPLLLMVRPYDAVRGLITISVQFVTPVRAFYGFVCKYPKEAAGTKRVMPHPVPVVFQSGTVAAIVQAMQKLRGHEDFTPTVPIVGQVVVFHIVIGVERAEILPRMQYLPLLDVQ